MLTASGGLIESAMGCVYWDVRHDDGEYVEIHNLYVEPAFRRKGYARLLLESAIKLIRAQYPGLDMRVWVLPKGSCAPSERLSEFYASLGLLVMHSGSMKGGAAKMKDFKKEKPIGGSAPSGMPILSWGEAVVLRDGAVVYGGGEARLYALRNSEYFLVRDIERLAKVNPEHDWRIIIKDLFEEARWQRQDGEWKLYFKGGGTGWRGYGVKEEKK